MRLPKRGERGFTLIELLIVVAILGVLAAVVIPNVTQFFGKGEAEARRTEFHNVSLAVASMMVDNGISEIPNAIFWQDANPTATNQMGFVYAGAGDPPAISGGFPDWETPADDDTNPEKPDKGGATGGAANPGYVLYKHDRIDPDNSEIFKTVSYLNMSQTVYFYTCESDGTVRQWASADTTDETGTEYVD